MGILIEGELSNLSQEYTLIDYYKMMDAILISMSSRPDEIPLRPDVIAKNAGLDIEKPIAYMLCAKMSREGYIQKMESGTTYTLKAEGLFFTKIGGYLHQHLFKNAESIRLETIERRQIFHQRALTWLTIILTVATVIQAISAAVVLYWQYGWFRF